MRVANQGFPGVRQPQASDFKAFTKNESRDTSHGHYVFHESLVTKHESRPLCFSRITKHETRNTAFFVAPMVLVGTEALQSFFRSGDGVG